MKRSMREHLARVSELTLCSRSVIEPVVATDFFTGDVADEPIVAVDEFVYAEHWIWSAPGRAA